MLVLKKMVTYKEIEGMGWKEERKDWLNLDIHFWKHINILDIQKLKANKVGGEHIKPRTNYNEK
jgi:hypothetical protein